MDFTRKRKLEFPTLVGLMLQLVGGQALQDSLDGFFKALLGHAHVVREATKSAFNQARKKLRASAFSALNRQWVQGWLEGGGCGPLVWVASAGGRRVLPAPAGAGGEL